MSLVIKFKPDAKASDVELEAALRRDYSLTEIHVYFTMQAKQCQVEFFQKLCEQILKKRRQF